MMNTVGKRLQVFSHQSNSNYPQKIHRKLTCIELMGPVGAKLVICNYWLLHFELCQGNYETGRAIVQHNHFSWIIFG